MCYQTQTKSPISVLGLQNFILLITEKMFQAEDQDPGDVLQLVLFLLHALRNRSQLARTYWYRQMRAYSRIIKSLFYFRIFSIGTLFISFLIAAILDVPGKLLALVACVRIHFLLQKNNHDKKNPIKHCFGGKNKKKSNYFFFFKTRMGRRFPYIGLNCFAGLFFIINCFLPRCFLFLHFCSVWKNSLNSTFHPEERTLTRCLWWLFP